MRRQFVINSASPYFWICLIDAEGLARTLLIVAPNIEYSFLLRSLRHQLPPCMDNLSISKKVYQIIP